ncbi:MAG: DNA-binding LytR/AlgR family response regulator [Salibacteraceae bacterium]|jgi:DNA-binding LytR/AlgR family response regulator
MKTTINLGSRRKANPSDIAKLEAQDNYTLIHFTDGTELLSSTTIGTLEKRLQPFRFFRTNRSTVINLDYLDFFTVHYCTGNKLKTSGKNSKDIFLSRRREAAFAACVNA